MVSVSVSQVSSVQCARARPPAAADGVAGTSHVPPSPSLHHHGTSPREISQSLLPPSYVSSSSSFSSRVNCHPRLQPVRETTQGLLHT